MYITANYFAFYSNVFGFVTKLLIPVVSVERISKEKTAKIIPNAIGVATADERHVFGSFMSRESAYRLMLSVWRPTDTGDDVPCAAAVKEELMTPCDVDPSSVEDDSSCSVSGNESPTVLKDGSLPPLDQQTSLLMRQRLQPAGQMESSTSSGGVVGGVDNIFDGPQARLRVSVADSKSLPGDSKLLNGDRDSVVHRLNGGVALPEESEQRKVSRTLARASDSLGVTWLRQRIERVNLKFPTDIHIVYLGVILAIILALFSGFLLYRIMDIQARSRHLDYWVSGIGFM